MIAWCWAINGATSAFASLLALAVGLQLGISAELIGGWAAYGGAVAVLVSAALQPVVRLAGRLAVQTLDLG